MKPLLYSYLALSLCYSLYLIVTMWMEDRKGRDVKFGYNFKYDDGRFCIGVQVWILLLLSLPFVNLIWVYVYAVDFITKWRNK